MPRFAWREFLTEWSREVLQYPEFMEDFMIGEALFYVSDELFGIQSPPGQPQDWLGYPSATEAQIAAAEERLETVLPPSYREFLAVSNGWRGLTDGVDHLYSTAEVDWFRVREADVIALNLAYSDPCTEEQYLTYDEHNEAVHDCYRSAYLQTALQISTRKWAVRDIWMLNPQVVTPEGEWEAWHDTGHEGVYPKKVRGRKKGYPPKGHGR